MTELRLRAQSTTSASHLALQIVEATTRVDVCAATARALRAALGSVSAYVALVTRADEERGLEVVALDGDERRVLPVGSLLRDGVEVHATGRPSATWVAATRQLEGLREGIVPQDAVVVPIGSQGVAVALVDGSVDASLLESATLVGATANAALRHVRALEDGRALTRRLQALLDLQRALASGILEDAFSTFAARLAGEVPFDVAWVGALPSTLGLLGSREGASEVEVIAVQGDDEQAPRAGTIVPLSDAVAGILRSTQARSAGATFVANAEAAAILPGARSAAIVPLVVHDALVGVLVLVSRRPHLARGTLLPDARWLLAAISEPLSMALQNAGLVGRLRSAMRDWQTTFDVMDSMVLVADEAGTVRRANWALARRLHATPSTLVGRAVQSLFPGQPLPGAGERMSLVGREGEPLRASGVSLPGGGTVVVIHDARLAPASQGSAQSYAALRRVSTASLAALRGRVLIVDDEPSILRAVSRTLGRSHDVETAMDGDEALARIRKDPDRYDAVMTDVQMPRLNGVELFRAIEREFPTLADRVLFMTGGVFAADVEAFLRSVKQRVLRKPFDPDLLRRAIDERVALSRVA